MPAEKFSKKKESLFPGADDCERPSCEDVKKALPSSMEELKAMSERHKKAQAKNVKCPIRSSELGHSSWNLLHTMAAWYPDQPSSDEKHSMQQFMSAFARFYPCTWCARDFQENIEKSPPQTESRKDLCQWLCKQHNLVNQKLGKPLFDCSMNNLDERWRKSSNPKCQSDH